jgi:aminotransferase
MLEKMRQAVRQAELSGLREVMKLAASKGCINLGPGTCELRPHPKVLEAARNAVTDRHNSYTPCDGIPELKAAIMDRYAAYNQMQMAPENVLVTCGATGAFESICKGFLEPGDEVILFEPFYKYHVRQIVERGGVPRYVRLHLPGWTFSPQELEEVITKKPKLLVMSNPNNPTGKVFSRQELETIGAICRRAGVIVVCDEVYENMTGQEWPHVSMASLPGMFDHTLTISSAGKTFLVTGWRVGWLIGPSAVMGPLGIKSDETYLCAPTPQQYAVADCLRFRDGFFEEIPVRFHRKRTLVCNALREAGFTPHLSQGAFYVLAGYEHLGYRTDLEAMKTLIEDFGIAAIPGNEFFVGADTTGMLRFCFAIEDDLLETACQRLANVHIYSST